MKNDKKFELILFGSGEIGYNALMFLGIENIECFCDNDSKLQGTEKYGKLVVSIEILKREHSNAVVIISANDRNMKSIMVQLEENGIEDYLDYKLLRDKYDDSVRCLEFLSDPKNRMYMRRSMHVMMIKELKAQVNYFKSYADITHMKPAVGELRERQLKLVKESAILFQKLCNLDIKPVLDSGNLLGYVRNGGFVPWDDDVDFTLIRDEYDRLKQYCENHIYTKEEFYNKKTYMNVAKSIEDNMKDYYWVDVGDHFYIMRQLSKQDAVGFDFFSLDYYADNYSFEKLVSFVDRVKEEWIKSSSRDEQIECMRKALKASQKHIAKKSDHIYFGIDSMTIMHRYRCHNEYIPSDVLYPLKKVLYEGEYFWIPNKPEEFVSYEYDNIWDFPDDIGIPRHL